MFLSDLYERLDVIDEHLGIVQPTTVKEICLGYTNNGEGLTTESVIHQAAPKVFDFDFPIFDENYRLHLEELIIKRYYFRQICCKDVGEWKLRLDSRLNEIMPYYNKIYESFDYLKDILNDVDYTRELGENTEKANNENTKSSNKSDFNNLTGKIGSNNIAESGSESATKEGNQNEGTSTSGNTTVKGEAITKGSDTPQGDLTGLMSNRYLTNATIVDTDESREETGMTTRAGSNSESNQTQRDRSVNSQYSDSGSASGETNTEGTFDTTGSEHGARQLEEHVKGKMYAGSKSKYVLEYRKAIINVDSEIVGRLADLFLNVY